MDTTKTGPTPRVRIRYLVLGAVLGVPWAVQSGNPPWEHALRTLIVLAIALPAATVVLHRYAAKSGRQVPRLRHGPLIAAKLGLVVAAMTGQWLLAMAMDHANIPVGIALVLAVSILGPKFDHFFISEPAK